MADTTYGKLVDKLVNAVNKQIRLETEDGVFREGRLSKLGMKALNVDGVKVQIPTLLELNGDPNDFVELYRVRQFWIKKEN